MEQESGPKKYNTAFFAAARRMARRDGHDVRHEQGLRNKEGKPSLPHRAYLALRARRALLAGTPVPFRIRHFKAILLTIPPFRPLNRPLLAVLLGRCFPIVELRFMSGQNPERLNS